MFVMTEDGKLYVFVINEIPPIRTGDFIKKKAVFSGELVIDQPILVKNLPPM